MNSENPATIGRSGEGDHKGFLTLHQHLSGFGRSLLHFYQLEVFCGR
jgi:hypothetical protein